MNCQNDATVNDNIQNKVENKSSKCRKQSDIRNYFNQNDNSLVCNINNCIHTFSIKTATSTLRYHVYRNDAKITNKNIDDITSPNKNLTFDMMLSFFRTKHLGILIGCMT